MRFIFSFSKVFVLWLVNPPPQTYPPPRNKALIMAYEPLVSPRSTPHPVTVTTRIITFLVGNPYKPSFATVTGWGVDPRFPLIRPAIKPLCGAWNFPLIPWKPRSPTRWRPESSAKQPWAFRILLGKKMGWMLVGIQWFGGKIERLTRWCFQIYIYIFLF